MVKIPCPAEVEARSLESECHLSNKKNHLIHAAIEGNMHTNILSWPGSMRTRF